MLNLPETLNRFRKLLLVTAGILIAAMVIVIVVSVGDDGDDHPPVTTPTTTATSTRAAATGTSAPSATPGIATPSPSPSGTATPSPSPSETATPSPNRRDCEEIRGTDYLSPDERQWFLQNCVDGSGQPSDDADDSGRVYATEYEIGARLIIPSIGVNTVVTGADVRPDGVMPDPVGYFNAVLYSFPYHPGFGGTNKVISGHVDCARCVNGGPGAAVFWSVRSLTPGATAQYVNPDGSVTEYVVFSSYSTDPNIDWSPILASDAADMTLITCTGTFAGGHYSDRYVVRLRIKG